MISFCPFWITYLPILALSFTTFFSFMFIALPKEQQFIKFSFFCVFFSSFTNHTRTLQVLLDICCFLFTYTFARIICHWHFFCSFHWVWYLSNSLLLLFDGFFRFVSKGWKLLICFYWLIARSPFMHSLYFPTQLRDIHTNLPFYRHFQHCIYLEDIMDTLTEFGRCLLRLCKNPIMWRKSLKKMCMILLRKCYF